MSAIVVLRYYNELVGFFSRSLRDRDAAADIVHECYARVLAMEAASTIHEPRALLYRVGKNIVTDAARRKIAETHMLETLALIVPDEAPSPERHLSAHRQLDRLLARLDVMPRKRRDAFLLVRLYGFTHAEAAAQLNCSEVAVEKHIVRGVIDCMDLARMHADVST